MWEKGKKQNNRGGENKGRDIMVKVGFNEITIIFCLWPCLFYSDYTKTQ